jgi:hypothetical protein
MDDKPQEMTLITLDGLSAETRKGDYRPIYAMIGTGVIVVLGVMLLGFIQKD